MKKIVLLMIMALFTGPLSAQTDLEELFRDQSEPAAEDARKLIKGYLTPLVRGFGYGMANGWNNTAKAHDKLGFDITLTVNAAIVPDEDLFYNIPDLNLNRLELISGEEAPTLFGPDQAPRYLYTDPITGATQDFDGPPGIGLKEEVGSSFTPVPMAQVGIGLFANTDLKFRFLPNVGGDDYKFNMWGIGIMHDIKQHIPGLKSLPFDLSVFAGYTDLKFRLDLQDPNNVISDPVQGVLDNTTFTGQILVSKKFSVITLYGGLGYNQINSKFNILGTIVVDTNENGIDDPTDLQIKDPVQDLIIDSSGARGTAGFQLKLAVITIHADYTFQEYDVLTVGLGVSVR